MAEHNPAVADLLGALGGDAVSPELASFVHNVPPPTSIEPPPSPSRSRTANGGMNKTEEKALVNEARAGTDPIAGMKKFGELARLVGNGARVRVRKRLLSGHLSHINDYSQRDVEFSGDVESFLNKWVKPQRGGGHYEVALIDQKGVEYHVGIYILDGLDIDPATAATNGHGKHEDSAIAVLRDMLNRPQPLPPDPIDQLRKAQTLMDSFAPKTGGQDNLFAMMMQMQQTSSQQMMALLTQKPSGPDPQILALLDRMDRRMEKLEAAPPPPPPPPPMMPAAPAYTVPELISAIATAVGAIVPLVKGDPGIRPAELVSMMQANAAQASAAMQAALGDRLTARDVLQMQQQEKQNQSGPATLVEQIQQLATVKEFAAQLSPPPAGPQGTTFWDAVVTLVGNQTLAESLGQRIAKGGGDPPAQKTHIEDHGRGQMSAPKADPQIEAPKKPAEEQMPFPANFGELCKAIDAAQDDAARAEAVFEAIKSLQPYPQWQKFVEGLLVAIAKNEQARAVGGLGQWLAVLTKLGHLSSAGGDRALATFDRTFAVVRAYTLDKAPLLRPFAPEFQAAQQAAPATPPEPSKPVVGAAPEENGAQVQTGPAPTDVDLPEEYG